MNSLHYAAQDGCAEEIAGLLSMGLIDIGEGDQDGWSPLMVSAYEGHSQVARILLNRGADVSKPFNEGFTALHASS